MSKEKIKVEPPYIPEPYKFNRAWDADWDKRGTVKIGEIVGWRCWKLTTVNLMGDLDYFDLDQEYMKEELVLRSLFYNQAWHPKKIVSALHYPHQFKYDDMVNWAYIPGIHAFHYEYQAHDYYGWLQTLIGRGPVVIGTINMWGQVIEHTEGYRTEYASVRSLEYLGYSDKEAEILQYLKAKYEG